ncbi:MAG: bifunctional diaminohydroxyphosphoribosylaminopyrimidine deaminase/5-amino-6-(5-phosphoribosylamino)uracil reductase RibD [bacterium]|nr:bifunctional diaminohydroxyphosphoribosylaminopyrimidine deaminase/5-amino-6-(5-phosphoribosylamino)uracil reductase RibD [bacterium]
MELVSSIANENIRFMETALRLGYENIGTTSPNPSVGAVIVKNKKIIATGATCPVGSDHAEVAAIKNARESLEGAHIYVSLEPCSHYGKTPPCTKAIIEAGIARVFIPILDPNPLVAGKGVAALREAGIDIVVMHELSGYAADLVRPFKKSILRHKPFIINKSALTLDGKIATAKGDSRWISSTYSRFIVHKLRAKVDAVIVGKNTLHMDNPTLSVRFDDFDNTIQSYFHDTDCTMGLQRLHMEGRDNFFIKNLLTAPVTDYVPPLRVVVGLPDVLDPALNIFFDDSYVIFSTRERFNRVISGNSDSKAIANKMNIELIDGETREEQVESILSRLKDRGVMLALLEGGGGISGSFFNANEIDQFLYFIAPKVAGHGRSPVLGMEKETMSEALDMRDVSSVFIKGDILYNGYKDPYNFEMM